MKAANNSHTGFCTMFLSLLLLLLFPATGFSLENERWSNGINFHFYPPGARALGMGGAFVGLADDATAAVSNPSGIAQLSRMQLAIEGRYASQDSTNAATRWKGGAGGQTGSGGFASKTGFDDTANVSYASFATPLFDNFLNLAVFYNKPLSFGSKNDSVRTYEVGSDTYSYFSPSSTSIDIYEPGVSVAKSFLEGRLMVGLGLSLQFFDMNRTLLRYRTPGTSYASPENPYSVSNGDGSGTGVAYRGGILGKPLENLRLGASFTINPSFDYTANKTNKLLDQTIPISSKFDVPDTVSLGAAYNIFPNWVVILEGKYVFYSQLEKAFSIFSTYSEEANTSDYSVNDIWEIHFGTEYVLNAVPNLPIAFRTGFFYEPAHDFKYNGTGTIQKAIFTGGKDLYHFTVGTGAVFMNHYQVDVGADFTQESRSVSLSMVYQF